MRSRAYPDQSLRQLEDGQVLDGTLQTYESVRTRTVEFLSFLAEFDRRKLFRQAGYPSAHQFCMQHMHMSEDQAFKHLRAARAARRFPAVLEMIADGRSNVSAITILSPRLTRADGEELLRASAGMTNAQVRMMLAERYPQPDVPTVMFALATRTPTASEIAKSVSGELASKPVEGDNSLAPNEEDLASPSVEEQVPIGAPLVAYQYTLVSPLSPASYALQCTLSASAHSKLREAQALLAPRVAQNDVSQVLEQALDALLERLNRTRKAALRKSVLRNPAENGASVRSSSGKRQRAAREVSVEAANPDTASAQSPGSKPEAGAPAPAARDPRHVPAALRRAIWQRDEGRCQFVSAAGVRCESTSYLEIDHVRPVALGGTSTLDNLRLLCRAHNQLEAEARLGREFMHAKRGGSDGADGT